MTLDEKIGQLLCLGWHAHLALDDQAIRCLEELHAGSMILMGRNVRKSGETTIDTAAVRSMTDGLQARAKAPLLIATDQEGGRVARFSTAPFTQVPPAMQLETAASAREAAEVMGRELAMVGVNTNFAPVADVNSNPANPVIGDRSFGAEPKGVAEKVVVQVEGYQTSGVLPCLKHFPGHGDTAVDSHFALPTLPHSLETMEARELVPFQAGIAAGCPLVMSAHILFPALDPELPGTLSPQILTGLLREKLGFDGVIVTDCLEMKAVADHWGVARAAVLAAKAGADLLLICHTWERQKEAFDALKSAVESGELSETQIDASVARIQKLKASLKPAPEFDAFVFGGQQTGAQVTLGEQAH
ncbi:MAG: beta-N-acetylhexosaminidase [Armatimonas sp.]